MADRKPAKKGAKKAATTGLTAEERAALKETMQERAGKGEGEAAVLEAIAKLPASDREVAERIHALVKATAPSLAPRTWYGMPAYAKDGDVICFFQGASKFKARYALLGFSDKARLDEGNMWPTSFALHDLTAAEEARIAALLRKALG